MHKGLAQQAEVYRHPEWAAIRANFQEGARQAVLRGKKRKGGGTGRGKRTITQAQLEAIVGRASIEQRENERIEDEVQALIERRKFDEGEETKRIRNQHEGLSAYVAELRNAALSDSPQSAFAADRLDESMREIIEALRAVARLNETNAGKVAGEALAALRDACKRDADKEAQRRRRAGSKRKRGNYDTEVFRPWCAEIVQQANALVREGVEVWQGQKLPRFKFGLVGTKTTGAERLKDAWVQCLVNVAGSLFPSSPLAHLNDWERRKYKAREVFSALWNEELVRRRARHSRYVQRGGVDA